MALSLRHKAVRRWTRIKTRLAYSWEKARACWCGGSLGPSRSPLVGECQQCGTGVLRWRLTVRERGLSAVHDGHGRRDGGAGGERDSTG